MLLDLCAAHPNSLLLKYAAEQLLHGAHAAEVAAHPALAAIGGSLSLASFSGFLSTQLGALQAEGGGGGAPSDAFGRLATSGEAQLLTALLLLEAAPWADGSAARRAAGAAREAMVAAATAAHGAAARRLALLAGGVPRHSPLMSCLLAALGGAASDANGTISLGDARMLRELYEASNPPPAQPLRSPAVLDLLLRATFDPSRAAQNDVVVALLPVLATAAAADVADAAPAAAGDAPADLLGEDEGGGAPREAAAAAALAALKKAQPLCARNEVAEVQATVATLAPLCADHLVVANGALVWAHANLTHPTLAPPRVNTRCLPSYLRLVGSIAQAHAALHRQVCAVLGDALKSETAGDGSNALSMVDLKKKMVDCLLLLPLWGCALPALAALVAAFAGADFDLVRYATLKALDLAAPPYSPPFAKALIAMLGHPRAADAFRGGAGGKPVADFVAHAREAHPEAAKEGLGAYP